MKKKGNPLRHRKWTRRRHLLVVNLFDGLTSLGPVVLRHDNIVPRLRSSVSKRSKKRKEWSDVHCDTANGHDDTKDGFVTDGSTRYNPAQSDNGTSLEMADNGTRYSTGLGNNEELRNVDQRRKETRLCAGGC